ncbi:hypothetical protein GCM10018784_25730 [Streptomyces hydrogenans]|nr:hypothetical protein GCM10018784_25730 [Streptomyces hydrogenans]
MRVSKLVKGMRPQAIGAGAMVGKRNRGTFVAHTAVARGGRASRITHPRVPPSRIDGPSEVL